MENIETTQNVEETTPEVEAVGGTDTVRTPLDVVEKGTHSTRTPGGEATPSEDTPQDMFPREYVEKLRKENASYRDRAKRADELAHRLFVSLVSADGRLADPNDLEFDEALLNDSEAMAAAIGELVARKPGLKARQFGGDVGAGARGVKKQPPADLISIIRGL